ncbi:DUF5808 domain-containing protein [Clostridium sp. DSM 100503]|uniref:DUF5808 domain-containing protein n=1 Tax=Clostridium sp. DSM 100503 TaxID=2963282 RepID=UPI00214A6CC8|nr:DUF5808 domain-containing protein [Clostridium sp. DSM 100503]MCR1951347.1 DUF5808 domain-containing protein [Clostridium sp. DSM 100503]
MQNFMIILTSNIVIITMVLLSYYLNNTSNKGIYFGVRIPKKYQESSEIKALDKDYKRKVLFIFVIYFVINNILMILNLKVSEFILSMIMTISLIGALLIHAILFAIYYKITRKLKEKNNWSYKTNNVVIVDTTLRKPKKNERYKALNEKFFLVPILISIIILVLTIYRREYILNMNSYVIYKIPIYQIIMCLAMYLLTKITLTSKVDLNSGNIETAVKRKKKFKRLISIFLFITEIEMVALYSVIQLGIIYNFYTNSLENFINVFISISMTLFIIIFILIGQGGRNIEEENEGDDLYKNDDDKWIWGMFYYNKNDPAWMVEKRVGIGYTINFANKKATILLILLILLIILFAIYDTNFNV